MKINGIEIKPGMVIVTEEDECWVVFPSKNGLSVISYENSKWDSMCDFIKCYEDKIVGICDLVKDGSLTGDTLWEKDKKRMEEKSSNKRTRLIAIRINNSSEYNLVKLELDRYNTGINPTNIGDWDKYSYLVYTPSTKELTNYSVSIIKSGKDVHLYVNQHEFVKAVKDEIAKDAMNRKFTKSDLKSGMVVKTKDKEFWLVSEDILIGVNGQLDLCNYNEDLTFDGHPTYNIVGVYDKGHKTWGNGFKNSLTSCLNPIWIRKDIKEVTMKEIAEKFGVSVEQIRIK